MAAPAMLAACTTQDFYVVCQEWQRDPCRKLHDAAERARCEKSTARSHDTYKAQADKTRSSPAR